MDQATEPKIKGSCLLSVLGFLKQEGTLDKVRAGLPEACRDPFGGTILSSSWYPVGTYLRFLDHVAACHPAAGSDLFVRMGRRIINDGLNTVYRIFLRVGSPLWVLQRSPALWGNYFKGSELRVMTATSGKGAIAVVEQGQSSQRYCWTRQGGILEAMELSGARNVSIEHTSCRLRGQPECVFEFTWTP